MPHVFLSVIESPLLTRFVRNVFLQHYPGCTILTARRAHEGATMALRKRPSIVVIDNNLADMGGLGFARLLANSPATSGIPLIIAHRSAETPDIRKFPQGNLVSLLPKPFAPEFLIASIKESLENAPVNARKPRPSDSPEGLLSIDGEIPETSLAPPVPPMKPTGAKSFKPRSRLPLNTPLGTAQAASVLFRGNTESFPLPSALAAVEEDHQMGVLRLFSGKLPTEVFFMNGKILLATTRDTVRYAEEMANTNAILAAQGIGMAHEIQRSNGCPVYLTLAREGVITKEQAIDEARYQSVRLVARAWLGDRTSYEFERLPLLPDYLAGIEPINESNYQWALAALRCMEYDQTKARRRLEAGGVPAYTPEGYELIQHLRLTSGEAAFASAVNNANSVERIAKSTGITVPQSLRELQKFIMLEIMDYWPPAVLAGA